MIVWSGKGFLIFALFLLTGLFFEKLIGFDTHVAFAVGAFVTAVPCRVFGRKWNKEAAERPWRKDEITGEMHRQHISSLFWIRMEHWFYILIVVGIVFVINP